jgi:hypothetical protein
MHNQQRRRFLQLAGLTGLSAATLPLMNPVFAASTPPKRVVFMYVPDGVTLSDWHAQGTGTNFTLPPMTQPLESVKQHCLFLSGIDMVGSGGTHEGGVLKLLTGTSGQYHDRAVSLDHYLGQRFKSVTIKPHLNLNIIPKYHDKHITFDFNKTPMIPESNPLVAFNSLFGNNDNSESLKNARRLSVLDKMLDEVNRLRQKLGQTEQEKLDTHLDSIRELEKRLSADTDGCPAWNFNPTGFTVTRTGIWENPEYLDNTRMELISDLHMDVAIHALSCDLTRIVTLKWNNSVNDLNIPESGSGMTCHGASHTGGNEFIKIKAWYMKRLAAFIKRLRDTPDGDSDGNLLDSTLVFVGSDLANSQWHNHTNMPFILAGGSAGGINTGRSLVYNNEAHNKILVSIARYMGAPINQFGTQDSNPGPLSGLLV